MADCSTGLATLWHFTATPGVRHLGRLSCSAAFNYPKAVQQQYSAAIHTLPRRRVRCRTQCGSTQLSAWPGVLLTVASCLLTKVCNIISTGVINLHCLLVLPPPG
jgi:hypothetical protein